MNITPIQIWKDGQLEVAEIFNLRSIHDDLATNAQFSYELRTQGTASSDGLTPAGKLLVTGELSIAGQDYQDWGTDLDVNQWIYDWAANKLGITILYL